MKLNWVFLLLLNRCDSPSIRLSITVFGHYLLYVCRRNIVVIVCIQFSACFYSAFAFEVRIAPLIGIVFKKRGDHLFE